MDLVTEKIGRKTMGKYGIHIDGNSNSNSNSKSKYVSMNELLEISGIKRRNLFNRIEDWLNTPKGRKWALETPHIEDFKQEE